MNIEELTAAGMVRAVNGMTLTFEGYHIADRADVVRAMLAAKFDGLVSVSKADIDGGVAGNCQTCPVALALRRRFPALTTVRVTSDSVDLTTAVDRNFGLRVGVGLPPVVTEFVTAFDKAKFVEVSAGDERPPTPEPLGFDRP